LVWLHLSDIHFKAATNWRDAPARAQLLSFLEQQFESNGLPKPDLIFCTGDIAYGEITKGALHEQYVEAKVFFDALRRVCSVPPERLFIVPGNHDINRSDVNEDAQAGLINKAKSAGKNAPEINQRFSKRTKTHRDAFRRLDDYANFVADSFAHQKAEDHIFARVVEINGKKIGIGGFNSAWSCAGDTDDRNLWLAADWQFAQVSEGLLNSDLNIGLIHHQHDWFNVVDRQICDRRIANQFKFWLHGHSHDAWVTPGQNTVHIRAGAVTADSQEEFGCNLVSLDFLTGKGNIHLFNYSTLNAGWTKACIAGQAPEGVWHILIPGSQSNPPAEAPPVVDVSDLIRVEPTTYPFIFLKPLDVTRTLPTGQFIGRIALKEALLKGLTTTGKRMGIFGVYGMGGIGKSQLAVEVVADLEQSDAFGDGILWLRIGYDLFEETLLHVWQRLGGQALATPDFKKVALTLKRALQDKRMLVVLDNADQSDRIAPLLDLFARQSILITSRKREIPDVDWLELDLLSAGESRSLLCKLAPALSSNTDAELDTLTIDRLGRLPLAISLAGHWLARTGHSLAEYIQRFDRYRLDALSAKGASGNDARKHDLRACFDVSWQPLSEINQQVFVLASMFGVQDFPESLLTALIANARKRIPQGQADATADAANALPEVLRDHVLEEDVAAEAIDQLVSDNLLSRPLQGRLAMHALLRDYGRERVGDHPSLHDIDSRALAKTLQQTLRDDDGKFVVNERELIAATLEQTAPWPDECWRLLSSVDGPWVDRGLNLLRERLLTFLLDSEVWAKDKHVHDRAALLLADAKSRLGKMGEAGKWLEAVNDSAERRGDDASVVRARYLLCDGNRLQERARWPDTMRRTWRSGSTNGWFDAIHALVRLLGNELGADLEAVMRSRLEAGGQDPFSRCLTMLDLAEALLGAKQVSAGADTLRTAWEIASREDFPELASSIQRNIGLQALRAGDLERAQAAFTEALLRAQQIGATEYECWAQLGLVSAAFMEREQPTPDTLDSTHAMLIDIRSRAERHGNTSLANAARLGQVEVLLLKKSNVRQVLNELNPLRRELICNGELGGFLEAELLATRLDLQAGLPSNRVAALIRYARVRATMARWWTVPLDLERQYRAVERLLNQTEDPGSDWQSEISTLAAQPYDLRPAWLACADALPERLQGRDGMTLCLVRAGVYRIPLNSDAEKEDLHQFLYPFYLDEHPVTVAQYARFCEETSHPMPLSDAFGANDLQGSPDSPVVRVSLDDVQAYARWAGRCVPVYAEWQAASRGKRGGRYPWGNELDAAHFPVANRVNSADLVRVHPLTSFDETRFLSLLEGSLSLGVAEKRRVLAAVPTLSQFQVDELFKVFEDELIDFKKLPPGEAEIIAGLQRKARADWGGLFSNMPRVCAVDGDAAECGARDLCGVVREWFAQNPSPEHMPLALGLPFGDDVTGLDSTTVGTTVNRDLKHHAHAEASPQSADANVGFRLALPLTGEAPLPEQVQEIFDAWAFKA
jgi:formylglycine-generating enzyme required for sulfatase activity/predicted phosphodiesterase